MREEMVRVVPTQEKMTWQEVVLYCAGFLLFMGIAVVGAVKFAEVVAPLLFHMFGEAASSMHAASEIGAPG